MDIVNKYKVIEQSSILKLSLEVNKYLNSGWDLIGGVAISNKLEQVTFYQSVVKYG